MHQWFKVYDKKWIVLNRLEAAITFLTSTKIIRTKKKIRKTGSYFRHGISQKADFIAKRIRHYCKLSLGKCTCISQCCCDVLTIVCFTAKRCFFFFYIKQWSPNDFRRISICKLQNSSMRFGLLFIFLSEFQLHGVAFLIFRSPKNLYDGSLCWSKVEQDTALCKEIIVWHSMKVDDWKNIAEFLSN